MMMYSGAAVRKETNIVETTVGRKNIYALIIKPKYWEVIVHSFNPKTWETEAGRYI